VTAMTASTAGAGAPRHVVVVGGSIAGLLAARALVDHVDRVTVLDRDDLPREPAPRGGVPQGRHVHGLLDRGRELLERWFPGLTDDLVAQGARLGDPGEAGVWCFRPEPLARVSTGLQMLLVSRPLLEWYVRLRLLQDGRVEIREDSSVLDLAFSQDEARVVGVIVADRDGGVPALVPAQLVVDASGRNSRTTEWLERRGYFAPPEEVRRIDKRYATHRVRPTTDDAASLAVAVAARPGVPRSGILLGQEDGEYVVSLVGRGGVQPPLAWPEFVAFARTLATPLLADVLTGMQPLDAGATYRFPANRRRRWERAERFPDGLVVTGDAFCVFDPVYGQGMTVAAIEADALGRCLAEGSDRLAERFHGAAADVVDTPWTIAVGGTPDQHGVVPLPERVIGAYLDRFLLAASADPDLAAAFLRVSHLHGSPRELLAPRRALRVATVLARVALRPTAHPPRGATAPPLPAPSGATVPMGDIR
jgi:2-polyprenyl-6-methoxyphenol hydroxylase-like FAD-dependent oxidoreductase